MKLKKFLPFALASAPFAVFAEGTATTYTVPQGVTDAVDLAKDAATKLANAAIPGIAYIAMAFVGIALIWLLVKAVRRGAK